MDQQSPWKPVIEPCSWCCCLSKDLRLPNAAVLAGMAPLRASLLNFLLSFVKRRRIGSRRMSA